MPIHKFIDFILNKALIFTSLTYVEDKFDGIFNLLIFFINITTSNQAYRIYYFFIEDE